MRGEKLTPRLLWDNVGPLLQVSQKAYVLFNDTVLDKPNFSVATGEQRSQGIELDIAGEILSGWNIIASYAYTDAKITEDGNSPQEENIPFGVPFNAASLWTTYEIQSGDLQGLGFGFGFFYVGERQRARRQ